MHVNMFVSMLVNICVNMCKRECPMGPLEMPNELTGPHERTNEQT
jgi:hypothetical protein